MEQAACSHAMLTTYLDNALDVAEEGLKLVRLLLTLNLVLGIVIVHGVRTDEAKSLLVQCGQAISRT